MAVDLSIIFAEKKREFRNPESQRFTEDFVVAARDTVNRMSQRANLTTDLTNIDSTAASIAIEAPLSYVIADGVSYFLTLRGQKPANGRTLEDYERIWEDSLGDFIMSYVNEDMETESNDVVGLGASGNRGGSL
jgi:hypothetical protein